MGNPSSITRRKRREKTLGSSTINYRDFFEHSLDAVTALDPRTGKYCWANPRAVTLFGVADEDAYIRSSPSTYSPERQPDGRTSAEKVREHVEAVMRSGSLSFEWKHRRIDGKEFLSDISLTRVVQGGETLIFAIIRDITERKQLEESLLQSRDRLELATTSARIGVWDFDTATGKVTWDAQMCELYGIREGDFSGTRAAWNAALHANDRAKVQAAVAAAIDGVRDFNIQFRVIWPDGEIHDIEAHAIFQAIPGTPGGHLIGVSRDITEHKRAERRLADSNSVLKATIDSSPEGVLVADPTGAIVSYNQRFLEMWRIPQPLAEAGIDDAVKRAGVQQLKDPNWFIERVRYPHEHAQETEHAEVEFSDGRVFDRTTARLYHSDGTQVGRIWFFLDITERKQAEEQIRKLARSDLLTGLPNRRVFVEALEQAIARRSAGSFAVLYMDLDHFKDVNDTLGHPVGDLLLQAVADRLRSSIRADDTIARFGGDEFALLLTNIEEPLNAARAAGRIQDAIGETLAIQQAAAAAGEVAGKIVRTVGEPFALAGNEVHTGASVGIAVYGLDSADPEAMLSHADVALYRVKTEARGTYQFFNASMDAEVRARVALGDELRAAIAAEQLFLTYQPQVEFDTGRIVGVEALVRWQHPTRGSIGAGHFVPEAERSGQIVPLGRWATREACRQLREWLDAGLAPTVAVNLSGVQFKRPLELEQMLAAAVAEFAIPQRLLELELTESVLMEASREHNDLLVRFRASGHHIAVDDFGSGYSSLDYLRRFPVDRIKIAQTFTAEIGQGTGADAIVKAALSLAHELGTEVVVEGAETAAQVELLQSWGCRVVQGFYFARPLPPSELTPLLRLGTIAPALAGAAPR